MTQCIKKIEIRHFKGLYGNYEINLTKNGNNLMLYGENGSGKSRHCSYTRSLNEANAQKEMKLVANLKEKYMEMN